MTRALRTTPEVVLTAFQESDVEIVHGWRHDQSVRDGTLGYPFPTSPEATRDWIRAFAPRGTPSDLCLAARDRHDGPPIGYVQLRGIDWIARCAEVGIVIGEHALRGRGYGRAVLGALLGYADDALALRRLWLRVAADNRPAIALYEAAGFGQEGTLRRHAFRGGALVDVLLYARERQPA